MVRESKQHKLLLDMVNVGFFYWRKASLFSRDRHWVLKDINLKLFQGETLGIIGRNGVGKSTLLRLLAGIVMPDKGYVERHCNRVSLLALQAGFNNNLTGRENIFNNALFLGMTKAQVLSKIDEIIEFAELEDFIDQSIKTYSTGMRARLGFSIAIQANPDLFILDEVLGVGDAVFMDKSVKAMKAKICSDQTVVLVSHNLQFINEVCDRVLWIENGTTRAHGESAKIIDRYNNYVATQRRAMNVNQID